MTGPEIVWDQGTVYDLFISIEVLHNPAEFNMRAVWAAGVRARIPAAHRKMLEQSLLLFHVPLSVLARLPQPRDANSVLWFLEQTPAGERLPLLALQPYWPPEHERLLRSVMERGSWGRRPGGAGSDLPGVLQTRAREEDPFPAGMAASCLPTSRMNPVRTLMPMIASTG